MDKLLLDEREVLDALSIGRTKLWQLKKAGDLVQVRVGRRSLITAESVHAYVDSLKEQATT